MKELSQGVFWILLILSAASSAEQNFTPVSGSAFLSGQMREMQEDDFANPGMDVVDYGRSLFHKVALGKTVWKRSKIALSTTADDGGHYGT
ncbi:hypothetical protein [Thiolapillus sp.]|uniref:hypothetical protein n=1 Tax=Thiolapillus sp. TaxID=2017437 RepID=UPI003AF7B700